MDPVSRLFPGPGNRRTTRVGIEHELLTRDSATGAPVAIERVRAATASDLSSEPGGQVELNQPCGAGFARGATPFTSHDEHLSTLAPPQSGQVSCWLAMFSPLTYRQTGTATVPPAKVTAS